MARPSLSDPRYYFNRHESWLAFNRRVLEEALDENNPLLERVKFLAITASNLDEFVEVRVAGLLQQVEHGNQLTGPDGLSPEEQLQRLARELHSFVDAQYDCWNQQLLPSLRREGIRILSVANLDRAGRDAMDLFFTRQVDPILTPVTIDPSHPFPHVLNKALCVAFQLRRNSKPGTTFLGVVTVPRKLPRLVRVPDKNGSIDYIFLHDLIETHTRNLYKGYKLKFPSFTSRTLSFAPKVSNLLEGIRKQDILLHHPYDSYEPVVAFVETAARDPQVLSIKQTLYRTNENSPIVRALIEAAQTKEVTVVVELKARFDEASNIRWARSLEEAGVQVFHGLVGLKTHCKLALLARQEPGGEIRQYAHLGTGNYNPSTAHFYSDLSLLTCDPEVTSAVHAVFNFLTARSEQTNYKPLFVSPIDLAKNCIELIDREANHARRKRPARIIAKVNALLDQPVIEALYRASRAGVEIDLIIRGACALRPNVRDVSHRIRVRSIVGRFLEHSRIFYFANGGEPDIYLGSADWMPRNLYERVEVMFPVKDSSLRNRLFDQILQTYLRDDDKTRILRSDGSYARVVQANNSRPSRNGTRFSAQRFFVGLAEGKSEIESTIDELQSQRTPNVLPAAS
jgi:polyphosphate kinase